MRSRAGTGLIVVVGCAIGCRAVDDESWRPRPPEWIELSAGVVNLDQRAGDVVDDAASLSIGGGYDFVQGPLDFGFELALLGSSHDVDDPSGDEANLKIARYMGGLRATVHFGSAPVAAFVRGGYLWREENDGADLDLANDQAAWYAGGGLEWCYAEWARLGPFATFSRGLDDDREEWMVGLSARFYVEP